MLGFVAIVLFILGVCIVGANILNLAWLLLVQLIALTCFILVGYIFFHALKSRYGQDDDETELY